MNTHKEDRRVPRTRKMLKKALAELLVEKDFKNITIKDITERADLNRGTFYLHYRDTYDLLENVENELLHDFEIMIDSYQPTMDNPATRALIKQAFEYINENYEICKALFLCEPNTRFLDKISSLLMAKGLGVQGGTNTIRNQYISCFMTNGVIGTIKKWFIEEKRESHEEFLLIVQDIITNFTQWLDCNVKT